MGNNPVRYVDPSGHSFRDADESNTCGINGDCPSGYDLDGMRPPDKIDLDARGDDYGKQVAQALHYCQVYGCPQYVEEALENEYKPFYMKDPEVGREQAYMMAAGSGPEIAGGMISFGSALVIGGVYRLVDVETGETVYVGRSKNLIRRRLDHARNPEKGQYDFEVIYETNSYEEQRGLEQYLYDQCGPSGPPLNKRRPISLRNKNLQLYLESARIYLQNLW